MEIDFRLTELTDVDNLLILVQEYYEYDGHPFDLVQVRAALENLIRHPEWGRVWFICRELQAVGYVVLTLGYSIEYLGRDAFVDEIYIRESDRGQGIGRVTFQFLEDVCRSLEVHTLHLEVEHANTNAQAVYRKLGFTDQKRYLMTRKLTTTEAQIAESK
ncbi:GNAT family N-acetyltransferase [Leptolyngbya sp. FACHB-671]|uniref:GNAT family N-acetyltransferase n=1 Tax=Leptolyngbya sp. FACHB-671 TaxID=2692812 RepID=UPI001687FDD8|nr:GNAT family N-acetyltransferase [Leptolyngbya sp. FACHB-671]MBD2069453.1 GNAT family N-acetyltransferase [Leptolyngbya sp. FACHB-671]